ncbi:hypothetical protein Plhal304r1_c094g0173181 [Plasmopara halstedii]
MARLDSLILSKSDFLQLVEYICGSKVSAKMRVYRCTELTMLAISFECCTASMTIYA